VLHRTSHYPRHGDTQRPPRQRVEKCYPLLVPKILTTSIPEILATPA
jgi:hypothetical protein